MTFKSKISYGYVVTFLHCYLCYHYLHRLGASCYSAHHRPWGDFDRLHCITHPVTYVDWVSAVQLVFYTLTLAGRFLHPPFERAVLLYGTYVMNGAIWSAWWFLSSKAICSSRAKWAPPPPPPQEAAELQQCGSWSPLWVPVLHWWLYAFLRRYALGLAHWEHENQLMHAETVFATLRTTPTRTTPLREKPYFVYQLWAYFSSALPLLVWGWVLKPRGVAAWQPTDLADWPGLVRVALFAASTTCMLKIYLSFLHFQSRCIVWTEPFRRGVLIYEFEGEVKVGIIY
ncbi:hypothetical protein DFJ77DRAFT_104878 [Powellomyces hirtus]|nr:hypothetical protein DFJ77DRAFT_104878 [Powellomyces hirtus]